VRYEKSLVKVLHARFSFGRERLFIRYSAAVATDLRRFVSQIQRDYKTQVDLWQVGIRDETALIGCVGTCGRAACCCAWQCQPPAVNTRMAKVQDVQLNPVTANGRCGRLKCCLAYEYEQYRQEGQSLPEVGSTVRCLLDTQEESGVVIERNVMCGKLTVRLREGKILKLLKNDVELVHAPRPSLNDQTKGDTHEDSVGEWSEP
jgi:cell fate regulator YaaT (PSP1 superfamily)